MPATLAARAVCAGALLALLSGRVVSAALQPAPALQPASGGLPPASKSAKGRDVAPFPAGARPRFLNLVHVRVKPRSSGAYASLEAQIVRAYERAKVKLHWICLQSPKDSNDILYLNLYDSAEGPDRAADIYRQAIEAHPDLVQLQQRLTELTQSSESTLTTRRDDIDRPPSRADFSRMRVLRVTTFQIHPGQEGRFVRAIRTANHKDGAWLVYEANDSSTFLLITLKETPITRADGPPIPRTLRGFKNVDEKPDSRVYAVRPSMSHVPQAFVAANPQLWRPTAAPTLH